MESLCRGASGMDAARAVKGHGWPLYAGPRSVDGMREVERSEPGTPSPDAGARLFGSFWGDCQKGLAQQGETNASANSVIERSHAHPTASRPRPLVQQRTVRALELATVSA